MDSHSPIGPSTTDSEGAVIPHRQVLIVGCGVVGATLALALAQAGRAVTILEANTISEVEPEGEPDERSLTLSLASVHIFQSLGLWSQLQGVTYPVKDIHVSRQYAWGQTLLSAESHGVEALGYVVEMQSLKNLMLRKVKAHPQIEVIDGASLTAIEASQGLTQPSKICYQQHQHAFRMTADLIVAADGSASTTRQVLKLPCHRHTYDQTALVSVVSLKRSHQHMAYERFRDDGLLALIPRAHQQMGLIWTGPPNTIKRLLALDEVTFLDTLQQAFGYRAGRFTGLGQRRSYPLNKVVMHEHHCDGVVFVGNASQTVHPVAGQGLNLGLRDAAWLAEMIVDTRSATLLKTLAKDFIRQRKADRQRVISLTHRLATLPSGTFKPWQWGQSLVMTVLDLLQPLQQRLVQQAMGFGETKHARLAVGMALEADQR